MNDRIKKKKNKEAFLARGKRINQKKVEKFIAWAKEVTYNSSRLEYALETIVKGLEDCSGMCGLLEKHYKDQY